MLIKLFVLGGPGSGKSTMARDIQTFIKDERWSHERLNDYSILQEMADEDSHRPVEERRLRWLDAQDRQKGFDVLDVSAFDDALKRLEKKADRIFEQYNTASSKMCLATIEFARNDYRRAFKQFSPEFLRDAYYLYLNSSIEVCKQRIRMRVAKSPDVRTEDDYFVSEYIFNAYYDHVEDASVSGILEDYGIDEQQIRVIDNDMELRMVQQQIWAFVQGIVKESKKSSSQQIAAAHQGNALSREKDFRESAPILSPGTALSLG